MVQVGYNVVIMFITSLILTYQQSERNLSINRDSPYITPNLVNFGPEMAENGWRVFAHPLNFRIGRHHQPYRMDVI